MAPHLRIAKPSHWLTAFVTIICVTMLGLEVWRYAAEYRHEVQGAQSVTYNLANSLARHADDSLELADGALSELVDRLEHGDLAARDRTQLDSFLAARAATLPRLTGLFVYDAEGNWLGSSRPPTGANPNNADRAYFRHHRENPGRDPWLGPPVKSRSGNGEWIVTLSRRLDTAQGQFAGVVLATFASHYFTDVYAEQDLGQHGAVGLLARDGTVLARWPQDDGFVGRNISSLTLFSEMLPKAQSGAYDYVSPADNVARMASYRASDRFPLLILAALSRDEQLEDWRDAAILHGLVTLVIVAAIGFLGTLLGRQLKQRERAEARLAELATTDALTSLANRRAFDDLLQVEWRRAQRTRMPLSLVLIDLDRFKLLNDSYGHVYGDAALREVGRLLKRAVGRAGDLAARFGGEELTVLLPDTDAEGCRHIAETIRARIEALAIPHAENRPSGVLTASMGCATTGQGHPLDTAADFIAAADRALYAAKNGGRNRVEPGAPTLPAA